MTKKFPQKIAALAGFTVLGLAVTDTTPSMAATVTYDFTTDIKSGYVATYSALGGGEPDEQDFLKGFFSYDDSTLTGIGVEEISINEGLTASLVHPFGTTPAFVDEYSHPSVTFNQGKLLGLLAGFPIFSGIGGFEDVSVDNQSVYNTYSIRLNPWEDTGGDIVGHVQYSLRNTGEPTSVPESSPILGICLFGLAGVIHRRKRH